MPPSPAKNVLPALSKSSFTERHRLSPSGQPMPLCIDVKFYLQRKNTEMKKDESESGWSIGGMLSISSPFSIRFSFLLKRFHLILSFPLRTGKERIPSIDPFQKHSLLRSPRKIHAVHVTSHFSQQRRPCFCSNDSPPTKSSKCFTAANA